MPLYIPGHNYCGPFTKDFSKKAVGPVDQLAWLFCCSAGQLIGMSVARAQLIAKRANRKKEVFT